MKIIILVLLFFLISCEIKYINPNLDTINASLIISNVAEYLISNKISNMRKGIEPINIHIVRDKCEREIEHEIPYESSDTKSNFTNYKTFMEIRQIIFIKYMK